MYVVYEAAIQMVSDDPASYQDQPGFDFIKAVPASWDETNGNSTASPENMSQLRAVTARNGIWEA